MMRAAFIICGMLAAAGCVQQQRGDFARVNASAPSLESQAVHRGPILGVRIAPVTAEAAAAQGLAAPRGLVVTDVPAGTSAARAGLRRGDILIELAGAPLARPDDLARVLSARRAGEVVPVRFIRQGIGNSISVQL